MQENRQVLTDGDSQLKHVKEDVLSNIKCKVILCSVSGLQSGKPMDHIEHDTYDNVIIHVAEQMICVTTLWIISYPLSPKKPETFD